MKEKRKDDLVGMQASLTGKLDGESFDIFTANEPDYLMMFMSTYGTTSSNVGQAPVKRKHEGQVIEYHHSEVVTNNYKYREAVDAHNSKRHDDGTQHGLSIERTWHTHW